MRLRRGVPKMGWAGAVALAGCHTPPTLPPGHYPPPLTLPDTRTPAAVAPKPGPELPRPKPVAPPGRPPFELPPGLPGADAPPLALPRLPRDTPPAEREQAVRGAYPVLPPLPEPAAFPGPPLSLADLQGMAAETSPVVRRAAADAGAAYGQVIQAGLYPNPTVGYQADQIQPSLRLPPDTTVSGAGQQGGNISQLIKTAGKLSLARAVAGFDYINALLAVRRAQVDLTAAVRAQYFAVLVARQGVEVNRSLSELAAEVYRLQVQLVAVAGEAAGYEPLLLYAQAEQARAALAQSEATARAAWRQLAAAVGRPDLPEAALAGRADAPAPPLDPAGVAARVQDQHTDILTARNTIAQAETNLKLQKVTPIPDIQTDQYHQYDNLAQTYQFGVQVGVALPLFDRNQGAVRQAAARVVRANEDLLATRNQLVGRLAEAVGRYEAARAVAERYREAVLPNLSRAYRALVQRRQVDDPARVQFGDIVLAQQNLATALQAYLAALQNQWQAAVDVAALGQLDELYPPEQ